jgi:hypothetical protein
MTVLTAARVAELERVLGDPAAPDNPLNAAAVVAADERAEPFAASQRALDGYGMGAELVPAAYGGRLTRLDDLVELLRSVHRRDPSLGAGYTGTLLAAARVWMAGAEAHRRQVADLLLRNGRLAAVPTEPGCRTDFTLTAEGDRLWLAGRTGCAADVATADLLVVAAGDRDLLLDRAALGGRINLVPRAPGVGLRAVRLDGVEMPGCAVGADAVLDTRRPTRMLRALRRALLPAAATGALDAALRIAVTHLRSRRLYGGVATDLPMVRTALVQTFAELQACDAISLVATRAFHLLPAEAAEVAAAAHHQVGGLLRAALRRLAGQLGAHFYIREGSCALVQKLSRDLIPVTFGGAASLAELRPAPGAGPVGPFPDALFRLPADLPPIAFDRLATSGDLSHPPASLRPAPLDALAPDAPALDAPALGSPALGSPALGSPALGSPAGDGQPSLAPAQQATALAVAACLGVHQHNAADEFIGDPAWRTAVLASLGPTPSRMPAPVEERLFAELTDRWESDHGFGLTARPFG